MKKKFVMIFVMILFSLSLISGSSLLIYNNLAVEAPNNAGGGVEDGEPDDPSSANATISGLWSSYWANPCLNGSGTSVDPYIISSARQLAGLAYYSNSSSYYSKVRTSYFKLGANIDLSEHYWVSIGINYSFSGDFDGNGYVISGMTCLLNDSMVSNYRAVTTVYSGLFGYVSYSSSFCGLHNIVVSQPDIDITTTDSVSTFHVGVIAGCITGNSNNSGSTFEKCAVVGGSIYSSVTMYGNKYIGGLVGSASYLTNFSKCFNHGCSISTSNSMTMSAASTCYAGGLVGSIYYSDIKDSYCNEYMYARSFYYAGGIVGYSESTPISGCYFYSKYTSYMGCGAYGGGIAGYFYGGAIKSCFVQGTISYNSSFTYSGTKYYASIVGYLTSGSVYSCCWNNTDEGYGYGGGTWSNNNRYTISNTITSDPSAFFTSSSYLNNTGGYTWSITQKIYTDVYTWNYYLNSETQLNDGYPVLSWAVRSISFGASPYNGGTVSVYSSTDSALKSTSVYVVIGDGINFYIFANPGYKFASIVDMSTNKIITSNSAEEIVISDNMILAIQFTSIGYWSSYYDSPISSGSGTSDDPYLISTARQLAGLAYYSNSSSYYSQVQSAYFKLTTSIDLGDHFWIPIGLKSDYKFLGNFDGNGYIIKNMRCYMSSATDTNYQMTTASRGMGLFGYIGAGATIQNFVLSGVDISTASVTYGSLNYWFGGLAAYIEGSSSARVTITQVGVQGSIYNNLVGLSSSYRQIIGGISGYASYADISKCFNSARLQKTSLTGAGTDIWWSCGGIVGYMMYTTIDNSYNNGYIYYPVGYGGGIAGYTGGTSSTYSIISRCYSACIRVVSSSGGYVTPYDSPYLGYTYGGGLVGRGYYTKVYSSFSTLQPILGSSTSTTSYGAGIVGYATSTFYAYGCAYSENCGKIYTYADTSANISATEISTENQKTYLTSKAKSYFYTSSTYLAKDTTYSWDIYQGNSSSYVWNYLVGGTTITSTPGLVYTYQSCGLPVLSWSIRRIYINYSGSPGTITKSFHLAYPSNYSLDGSSIYRWTWTTSTSYIYGLLGQTVIGSLDSFTNEAVSFDGWGFTSSNLITTERQFEYQFDGSWSRSTLKYIYAYFTSSGLWTNYYASAFDGGSGTSSSPYEIATASQLARLAYLSNSSANSSYYKLTADIDLSEHLWKPIGLLYPFAGNFDGGLHVISGMKCYASSYGDTNYTTGSAMYMGLFARTNAGATIKNLILKEPNITTASTTTNSNSSYTSYNLSVGAVVADLVGNSTSSTTMSYLTQCGVIDGSINICLQFSSTIHYILFLGELVGDTMNAEISECFVQDSNIYVQKQASDLTGYSYNQFVGGVVGDLYYSTMQNCYFSNNVTVVPIDVYANYVGGLAGRTYYGKVLNCYVHTALSGMYLGYQYAGGLVGYHNVGSYIRSCFVNSKIYLNSHPDYTTTYAGTLAGSVVSGSYVWASCWYSGMNISVAYGSNSGTVSYCTSYSTSSYATSYSATTFYTSTSYLKNTNYGTAWDINYAYSRSNIEIGNVWNYGLYTSYSTKYGKVNDMYPVLSWALQEVRVEAKFSGGDPYFSESNDSTCIAIKGETVTLSNRSVYSGYSFDGWYKSLSASGLMSYDSTYELVVSDQILYYGVYNSTATQNITCYAVLQYGGVVKDITQSSTYGSVSATYWIGGSPYSNGRTAASALTSRNYFLGIEKYQGYDSVVFSASSNVTGYKFAGWYMTSGLLTINMMIPSYNAGGSSSSTLSYVPYSTTDINLYAIYTYDTYYTLFAGAYYSDDCGDTYTKQTSSTGTPYARFYGYSPGATSTTAYNVTTNSSYISLWSGKGVTLSSGVENYYYTFEGWYYNKTWSDDPSVFVSGATCFSSDVVTGFTGTSSSVFAGKYIFAKFVRKTPEITINIMTSEDGLTFTNSVAGGTPTISYYDINLTDASTSEITSATSSVIVLAGTELSVSSPGANSGYLFVGITSSSSCLGAMSPITSVTLGYEDTEYYVYYNKYSTNVLKYDKTENYYYFEDGYMPQTYAGMFSDTLNSEITDNGTLIGEGYESLKLTTSGDAPLYEYQLASYDGYYYLGIMAPQTMTLYLESATVRFSQQSTDHRYSGYYFKKGTLYWFRFEPIRWRITDCENTIPPEGWEYYGNYNTNYTVVSDSVLWYDALNLSDTSEGWSAYNMEFFSVGMRNDYDYTFLSMMNTFATNSSNKFLYSGTNTVKYQYFGLAGQTEIVKSRPGTSSYSLTMTNKYTSGDTSSLRIASLDEMTDTVGDTKARASCLVAFLTGMSNCKRGSGDVIYSKYWTRDLGNNLNAGLVIDKNGNTKSEWLSNCNGIRFAYTMSEGLSYGDAYMKTTTGNS